MAQLHDIILRPIITERSALLQDGANTYVFQVGRDANKIQIKDAVEQTFNVKVVAVNTLIVKAKKKSRMASRRGGRISGTESAWKKAIVTLDPNDHIELFEQI